MIVYRLCKKEYVNDLSGYGAEMNSGRWNGKGIPALYTSGSQALAVLEVAVHVPYGIMPVNYYMVGIELPEESGITIIGIAELPADWSRNPFPRSTQYIGDDFLKANTHLMLQVPSAIVPGDRNYIINPRHPDFKGLKIVLTEPFEFDSRFFKR